VVQFRRHSVVQFGRRSPVHLGRHSMVQFRPSNDTWPAEWSRRRVRSWGGAAAGRTQARAAACGVGTRDMRAVHKRTWVGVVALSAILALGAYTLLRSGSAHPVHAYTVAQVAGGLAQQPRAWIGRTIVVRGVAVVVEWPNSLGGVSARVCSRYPPCSMPVPPNTSVDLLLVDNMPLGGAASMLLLKTLILRAERAKSPAFLRAPPSLVVKVLPQPSQTLRDVLTHVPLLSQFVSQPAIQGGTPRIYRVRVLPHSTQPQVCTPACDDAVLLTQ